MVPLLLDFIGERDGHLHGALLVGRMLLYLHAMDHVHTGAVVVVALKDQICFFFFLASVLTLAVLHTCQY